MSIDLEVKAREVTEHGFCALEAVYTTDECEQMRGILDAACRQSGGFSEDRPGISFHPLFQFAPELVPLFAKPIVVETIAHVLEDDVRLVHNGGSVFAREFSGQYLTRWHQHYNWDIPEGGLQRDHPERVVCNVYVDGSNEEVGPLVVLPRHVNDPVRPFGEPEESWPGESVVPIPPGTAIIFDTALWHCSRRGTRLPIRHLWGGCYQGWHFDKPHHEDNSADFPAVEQFKKASPILSQLIDGRATRRGDVKRADYSAATTGPRSSLDRT